MAIEDYLKPGYTSKNPVNDKQAVDLLNTLTSYSRNTDVLKALGDTKPAKKPEGGFLSATMRKLGIPGSLVRAGLMELSGQAPESLQNVSGLQELKGILSGNIHPGFGETVALKTRPDDNLATRIVKYGLAFTGDVVTDPLSYISAPGALSRDAAAQLLVRHTLSDTSGFFEKIADLAPETGVFVENLASKSRQALTDAAKVDANLKPEAGVFLGQPSDVLAKQYLANHLAEGLKLGGRTEVLKRLDEVLGSKQAALEAFGILPEEVKGGIVLTGLTGKPITKPSGEYIRLTPGTGEMLGKPGEVLNKLRLGASVIKGPITRNTGRAGEILANTNKALWKGDEALGRDRFIDYVGYKDSLNLSGKKLENLQGAVMNAVTYANHNHTLAKDLEGYSEDLFNNTFEDAWHRPLTIKPNLSATEALAKDASDALVKSITALHAEMKALGIEVGTIGDAETWRPLVLSDKSMRDLEATERGRMKGTDYSTNFGRLRYMFFSQNAKEAVARGFQAKITKFNKETGKYDVIDNPYIYYNNAKSANEIEKALDPNTKIHFEENPVIAYAAYATAAANRIATHKMVQVMQNYGIAIKDVPAIREIVDAKTSANLQKLLTLAEPDIQAFYEGQLESFRRQLDIAIDPARLNNVLTELTAARDAAKLRLDTALDDVKVARTDYEISVKNVKTTTPTFKKAYKDLDNFEKDIHDTSATFNEMKSIVDDLNSYLAPVIDNLDYDQQFIKLLIPQIKKTSDPNVKKTLRLWKKALETSTTATIKAITPDQMLLESSKLQMDAAFAARDAKIATKATKEVADAVAYAAAVQNKDLLINKLVEAKKQVTVHRRVYNAVAVKQSIEDLSRLDNIVMDYVLAKQTHNNYKFDTRYTTADFRTSEMKKIDELRYQIPAEDVITLENILKEKVSALSKARTLKLKEYETVARAKRAAIKEALGSTRNKVLDNKIAIFVKDILTASDKLSEEEFQAYKILSSKNTTEKLVDSLNDQTIPDEIRNQMFGDLVRTYETIREIMPASAFHSADVATTAMLSKRGIDNIKKNLFVNKPTASEFGKYLGSEGMRVLNLNRATRDLYTSVGVNKLMEDMFVAKSNPTHFEKFVDDVLDPMLNVWKWVVTLGRGPGFVANNVSGGLTMNFTADVSFQAHKNAAEDLIQFHKTLSRLLKENPERSYPENVKLAEDLLLETNPRMEYLKAFLGYGGIANTESTATLNMIKKMGLEVPDAVFQGGVTNRIVYKDAPANAAETKYRETIDFILSNPVSRAFTDMGQSSELFLRYSAFLDGMEKYNDINAAMDRVYLLHFNYQDLSSGEQWLRRLVPFYTWTRNNVPAQFRILVMKPGKIQRFMYANEEMQNQFKADEPWMQQVLPEFIVNQDGFASRFKFGGNNIGVFLKLPYEDLNRLFTPSGAPKLQEIASMLGPATKTPLEVATGTNLSTGQTANPAGESVPGYYNVFRPFGLIESTTGGDTKANSKLVRFMNDVLPFLGTGERALSAAATVIPGEQPNILFSKSQQRAGLSNLLNVSGLGGAGGLSTTTLAPSTISAEVSRRVDIQRPTIKKLVASGNYDIDWIRKQLRLGKTPQEIAVMLQAGQGQMPEVVDSETGVTPAAAEKYRRTLGGL